MLKPNQYNLIMWSRNKESVLGLSGDADHLARTCHTFQATLPFHIRCIGAAQKGHTPCVKLIREDVLSELALVVSGRWIVARHEGFTGTRASGSATNPSSVLPNQLKTEILYLRRWNQPNYTVQLHNVYFCDYSLTDFYKCIFTNSIEVVIACYC